MPDLFSPYTPKGVTLRNRIVMSPMTIYMSIDGKLDDYHMGYLGARAGGFALVFGEQMAITPDGRTTTSRAGIWNDEEIEGHASPFSLVQQDWRWWLENFRGHAPSIGWPEVRVSQREGVSA